MIRKAHFTPWTTVMILLLGVFLVTACSDDDPVTPVPLPEPGPLAVSPDSLMSLWQTALTTMDSTLYEAMYHPEFRFQFSAGDMSDFDMLTDYMTAEETVQTGRNMFAQEDLRNWLGDSVPAAARITFPQMVQETPWEFVAVGSEPPRASARFTLQMFVERAHGVVTLMAAGSYDFFAMASDTVDAEGNAAYCYRWVGMTAVNHEKTPGLINSWGGVNLTYMTDEVPVANLQIWDMGGSPMPLYHCDATGSVDVDSGLAEDPYRWQLDGGAEWTPWSDDPTAVTAYSTAGEHFITVQVRDRWGVVGENSQVVSTTYEGLPFPDSPDQLMRNFQAAYETRNREAYRQILHPEFMTILQQQTIEEFPDVGTTLDLNEDLRIHWRMFSGDAVVDPEGNLVPGVSSISFSTFRALDTWQMSPIDDIIPNALWAPFEVDFMFDRGQSFSRLTVEGIIKFYVTSRDSLHHGVQRKFYEMAGQVDLTGGMKGNESTVWGSVKALFR